MFHLNYTKLLSQKLFVKKNNISRTFCNRTEYCTENRSSYRQFCIFRPALGGEIGCAFTSPVLTFH